jgi:TPR repeat protein
MFLYGLGAPKNYDSAYQWMGQAAESGLPSALYNIAKMTRDGLGVDPDSKIAFKLFARAAVSGHAKAQAALAIRYALADGVERDPTRALFWAYRARQQGVKRADETIKAMTAELGDEAADRIRKEAQGKAKK